MRYLFTIILGFVVLTIWAMQPVIEDHNTMMQKYDQEHPQRQNLIDEASPYFLLMGEADSAIAIEDYPTAILRLKDMLRVDPENPTNPIVYSNLGMLYNYMDQDSLALNAFDKALELAPNMRTVLSNRALLKLKMGRDADAWQDFGLVIQRDSLDMEARYYHGLISLYGGDRDGAWSDFQVMDSEDPEGDYTITALATYYSLTRNDAKAAKYFEKLIEKDPCPENYAALAGCLLEIGEYPRASEVLAEGIKQWPEDPELYYYRARLKKLSYLNDEAKADAQRALQLGINPARVKEFIK